MKPKKIVEQGTSIAFESLDETDEKLRREIPDLVQYLQPGQKVINVEYPKVAQPTKRLSVLRALNMITSSAEASKAGGTGPIVASVSTEENYGVEALNLYGVVFGRDSLRVSLDLLDRYPKYAHSTIALLSELQGTKINPRSGEEPGRIIHEQRNPETDKSAQQLSLQRGLEWPYYESIDATPMYLTCIKRFCEQASDGLLVEQYLGRDGKYHTIAEYFQKSVHWLLGRLDESRRGLLESNRKMGIDPENWKDNWEAYSHEDGSVANLSDDIALIDVQALAYDALIDAAIVYERYLGDVTQGVQLRETAEGLRAKILNWFWVADDTKNGGYFCAGLDYDDHGNSRQLKIRTSDMGHLLNSRMLDGEMPDIVAKKECLINNLFSPAMLNASGIRTLAKDEKRFNPFGYQTGSVFEWDTYYISQGLERQGYYGLSELLKMRIWRVSEMTKLFPEFVQGGDDPEPKLNTRIVDVWDPDGLDSFWDGQKKIIFKGRKYRVEQPPQQIQAWTVAAILASKYRRDPLHPDRAVPIIATNEKKLVFETRILESLKDHWVDRQLR